MDDYKYLADLHTHTVASGHARNTIEEMVAAASKEGLALYGITEHSMTMPGTCRESYFRNLKNERREFENLQVCFGVELNIMDYEGNVDMDERLLKTMDIAIASIHNQIGYHKGNIKQNTNAILGAIKNQYVNIIGHPDDSNIPLDYEVIVKASKEYHTLIEINNNSLSPNCFRVEPEKNDARILELCMKYNVPIIIGSDAHSVDRVGKHEYAMKLIEQVKFNKKLVLNYYPEELKKYLNKYR